MFRQSCDCPTLISSLTVASPVLRAMSHAGLHGEKDLIRINTSIHRRHVRSGISIAQLDSHHYLAFWISFTTHPQHCIQNR